MEARPVDIILVIIDRSYTRLLHMQQVHLEPLDCCFKRKWQVLCPLH
jgi:hypothetical protein